MYGLNHKAQVHFELSVACAVISAAAIVVRIYCKLRHKQGVRADDYWIIIGLYFYWVSVAINAWGSTTSGGGLEMKELLLMISKDPSKLPLLESYLMSLFLGFTFIIPATYAIKISVLFFYRRVLLVTQGYRRISLGLMVLSTAWFIGTEIANLLICQPVDAFWHRTKPGKCSNFNIMFLGTGIVETLIDLIILILPLRIVLRLHLPMRTRVAVAGIFALGGVAVITNIIRIQYIYQPHARYVNFAASNVWSNIHLLAAIVGACLPVYKPLWTSVSQAVGTVLARYASSIRSMFRGSSDSKPKNSSYVRMGNMGKRGTSSLSKERILRGNNLLVRGDILARSEVTVADGREPDVESLHVRL